MQERWSAVDEYVTGLLAPNDAALEAAIDASEAAGLPAIQVSPPQGKLLHLLARSIGARTILEFGTLGAYSTIWLARALPEGGHLVTLEADPPMRRSLARASPAPSSTVSSTCASERRPEGAGAAPAARDHRRRGPCQRDHDPGCGCEGL